jgi:mRNA interferase MazF
MKKRGEIWWINFDPSIGQEIRKKRPAVIVSNDTSNKYLRRYQVVPLSSQVSKIYPSETKIQVGNRTSKAMVDQLTTVSELRFLNRLDVAKEADIKKIEEKIKIQLDLEK